MQFYLSLVAAIGTAVSLILHALGAKSAKAEKVAEAIDKAEAAAAPILPKP